MRRLFGLALILTFSLLGCTESSIEEDINNENKEDVDYYVKYHYYGNGGVHICTFNITFLNSVTSNSNSAENTIIYKYPEYQSKHIEDEIICGPFKKGDKASIEMSNESSVVNRLLEIYVSKNNSPFALRKSTNSRKLEYTIDY